MSEFVPGSDAALETEGLGRRAAERLAPFRAAPVAMLAATRGGLIVQTNSRLDEMFGYAEGELIGRPLETLLPDEAHERHRQMREAFAEYPVPRQMGGARDLFGVSKDGRQVPVEIGLATFAAGDETLVLAFVIDLTQRKKQEAKFRGVADAAANGLLMVDEGGRVVFANALATSMFGYPAGGLGGLSVEELIPERFGTKHGVYRGSYSQAPEPRRMGEERSLAARRRDGTEFPVEIGLTPLDAHDGRFVVATVVDITQRRETEEEIRTKNAELSRLNGELTTFSYSVSHDLKAPLVSIQGLSDLVMEDIESGDSGAALESMGRIRNEARHLSEMIENVLALTKADHLSNDAEEIPLRGFVGGIVESLEPLAEQRGVELKNEIDEELVVVTQLTRLWQVLENLVSNGIKYSDPERDARTVCIRAAGVEGAAELSVEDNGLGIPAECHDQVFGMFRRFHGERGDGSGLGLALTKKHVDLLGGDITFTSSQAGTRFVVSVPQRDGGRTA